MDHQHHIDRAKAEFIWPTDYDDSRPVKFEFLDGAVCPDQDTLLGERSYLTYDEIAAIAHDMGHTGAPTDEMIEQLSGARSDFIDGCEKLVGLALFVSFEAAVEFVDDARGIVRVGSFFVLPEDIKKVPALSDEGIAAMSLQEAA